MIKNSKPIPILYQCKDECCGCTACYSICPTASINMLEDSEGFSYPFINSDTCVRCGMCLKVCPIKDKQKQNKVKKANYSRIFK